VSGVPGSPQVRELANGLTLIRLDLAHLQSVSLSVQVRGGGLYETKDNFGISHLLEHLHLAVSRSHPARMVLAGAIDDLGGDVNGHVLLDRIVFDATIPADRFSAAAMLLAEMLEPHVFGEEVFHSELRLIENELANASHDHHDLLRRRLFPRHPLSHPTVGNRRSLRRLNPVSAAAFDARVFQPRHMVVAIAGRIQDDQYARVEQSFGSLPDGSTGAFLIPPLQPYDGPHVFPGPRFRSAHGAEFGFVITGPLTPMEMVSFTILLWLSHTSSVPLWHRTRYGRNATYYFGGMLEDLANVLLVGFQIQTHRRRVLPVLRIVMEELTSLRRLKESPDWWDRIKRQYTFRTESSFDSAALMAYGLADNQIRKRYGKGLDEEVELETVRNISVADFSAVLQKYLTRENLYYMIGAGLGSHHAVRKLVDEFFPSR